MANIFKKSFGQGAAAKGGQTGKVSGTQGQTGKASSTRGTIKLEGRRFDKEGKEISGEDSGRKFSNEQILSGTFSSVSAFGDIAQGFQQSAALTKESRQLDLAARGESLRGAAAAINESVRATQSLGSQFVGDSALFTGSSAKSISAEFEDVQTNVNIIRFGAEQRSILLRGEAIRKRRQAKFAIFQGFFKASERAAETVVGFFGTGGG